MKKSLIAVSVLILVVVIASCGEIPYFANFKSTFHKQHNHEINIKCVDILKNPGGMAVESVQGQKPPGHHTHTVNVTAEHVSAMAKFEVVQIESETTNSHTHTFPFHSCGG